MPTLAVYHTKGGVGKTATAVNLAYLAAQSGAHTLLCDLDPQSAATFYFRVKPKLTAGIKTFIKGGKYIERNIKGTDYDHLDLLPAALSHRHLTLALAQAKRSKQRLHEMLEPLKGEYAYIILDCPPTLTLVAENVLIAADYVLVPVTPSTLSLRAYQQLRAFCSKKSYDQQKMLAFFSMVEKGKKLHRDIMDQMLKQGSELLHSAIPYVAEIEKMGLVRAPVPASAPHSPAAQAYQHLWHEVQGLISNDGSLEVG
jgi:cellulose biosynthesis protein BcsQ